jgi:hypothetical protein
MTATRSLRPLGSFSPSLMAATETVRLRVLLCAELSFSGADVLF